MRVLAEFLRVHGAPIEEVLDTVYNTPTQVAIKAAGAGAEPLPDADAPASPNVPTPRS